jgi:hypothetical protein
MKTSPFGPSENVCDFHFGYSGRLGPTTQTRMKPNELSDKELGAVRFRALTVGGESIGALALGAVAVGALALGAVAIGRLAIGRAKIKRLEIEELRVGRLQVTESIDVPGTTRSKSRRSA